MLPHTIPATKLNRRLKDTMAKSLNSEEKIAAIPSVRNEYTGQIWTLEDVRREIEKVSRLLTQEGYKPRLVRSVAFNPRLTRSCGRTRRINGTFEMDFSVSYFKKSGADSIRSTIAHETIHTVPGCFNHGDCFKAAARCLKKHGYHVGRLCRDEEYAKYITQEKALGTTYHVVCEGCGWDGTRRKKLSKILKGIMQEGQRRYSCPVCGSHKLSVYRVDFPGLETQLKSIKL